MTAVFEIPVSPRPQRFRITLAGEEFIFRLTWCDPAACWTLNISDQDDTPLVHGISVVTGVNLLEQFGHLLMGFGLIALTDHDVTAPPTFENLGLEGHLRAAVPAPE